MSGIETVPGQIARMIPGKDAQRLADLTGVQRDLELVAQSCRVIEARKDSPAADDIRRACFDSAVLRYRRCFKNSIRELLPKARLSFLTAEETALHDAILLIADKSVAHCVDGSEENISYALLGPKQSETVMRVQILVLTGTVAHHNKIDVPAFSALALKIKSEVRGECDALAAALLEELERRGAAGIAALPVVQRGIDQQGEVAREKYRGRIRS